MIRSTIIYKSNKKYMIQRTYKHAHPTGAWSSNGVSKILFCCAHANLFAQLKYARKKSAYYILKVPLLFSFFFPWLIFTFIYQPDYAK